MDANENPYNHPYNRYPDPLHRDLKNKLSHKKQVAPQQIFLGNGSDEAIDLLIRAFCEPKEENIITVNPTYGMYKVSAAINDVRVKQVSLTADFQLDVSGIRQAVDDNTKMIFLCSPNNPTGNAFRDEDMEAILNEFKGIVVIDEAYIDFADKNSFSKHLNKYPHLVVLQTFSKAFGMAGIRLGMALGNREIIEILNKIKYPYNLNIITQKIALKALSKESRKRRRIKRILKEKEKLIRQLRSFSFVQYIYPSDANFFIVQVEAPKDLYHYLVDQNIIIRDRSDVHLCNQCLRFTVGTPKENRRLVKALREYQKQGK